MRGNGAFDATARLNSPEIVWRLPIGQADRRQHFPESLFPGLPALQTGKRPIPPALQEAQLDLTVGCADCGALITSVLGEVAAAL